jgi:hypothetical protein
MHTYIYHSRLIPEGVAEVSQIFLRDTHVSPKLVSYEEVVYFLYNAVKKSEHLAAYMYICGENSRSLLCGD